MIGKSVDTYENHFRGYSGMRVAPDRGPRALLTHNAPELKMKKVADKKTKVPRPPNAFILYRQHHHPLVKAEYPDMHNNQICKSISRKLAHQRLMLSQPLSLAHNGRTRLCLISSTGTT